MHPETEAVVGRRGERVLVVAIAVVIVATYGVPFLGPVASLMLIGFTHGARPLLWPSAGERESGVGSLVAWVGLWFPAGVDLFTSVLNEAGISSSTSWLIIPLCAPDRAGTVWLPAAAAAAVCFLGLALARARRRPWPWVVAAWLAPWVHQAVFSRLPHELFC